LIVALHKGRENTNAIHSVRLQTQSAIDCLNEERSLKIGDNPGKEGHSMVGAPTFPG